DDVAVWTTARDVARQARQDPLALEGDEGTRCVRGAEREPHRAVGPDRRPVDAAGRGVEPREDAAVEVAAIELAAAAMVVQQQQRARVRVPRRLDLARQ